jgi:uncharacterized protein (DUF983 family)
MKNTDYFYNRPEVDKIYMNGLSDVCVRCNRCFFAYDHKTKVCKKCESNIRTYLPDLTDEEVNLWLQKGRPGADAGNAALGVLFIGIAIMACIFTSMAQGF